MESTNNNLFTVEQNDVSLASFKLSMLNRYFIFRRNKNILTASKIVGGLNHQIDLGKFIMPYFDRRRMLIDPSKKHTEINKIYHAIRRKYKTIKPSVYLMKHNVFDDKIDDQIYQRNKICLSKIKNGSDSEMCIIYKSPDKYFYPVYYQKNKYPDPSEIYLKKSFYVEKNSGSYLFTSDKIINDIDMLIALTDKINQ